MKTKRLITAAGFLLFLSLPATHAFNLSDLTESKKSESSAADTTAALEAQRKLLNEFISLGGSFAGVTGQIASSLGLKDEADALVARVAALKKTDDPTAKEVNVLHDSLLGMKDLLLSKLDSTEVLSAKQSKDILASLDQLSKISNKTRDLLPLANTFMTEAQGLMKGGSLMDLPKLKQQFDSGLALAQKVPGFSDTLTEMIPQLQTLVAQKAPARK